MCPKTRLEKLKGGLKAGRPWFIEAASVGGLPGRRGPLLKWGMLGYKSDHIFYMWR